jgi:hypothetical protein
MLWNNLVCFDCLNLKLFLWNVCNSNPDSWTFDFIKILTQITNNFSNIWQKKFKSFNLCRNGKGTMIIKMKKPYAGFTCWCGQIQLEYEPTVKNALEMWMKG